MAYTIEPNDRVDLPIPCKRLYVGGQGDLSVIFVNDEHVVKFEGLPKGLYDFTLRRIMKTGTTAKNLICLATRE